MRVIGQQEGTQSSREDDRQITHDDVTDFSRQVSELERLQAENQMLMGRQGQLECDIRYVASRKSCV